MWSIHWDVYLVWSWLVDTITTGSHRLLFKKNSEELKQICCSIHHQLARLSVPCPIMKSPKLWMKWQILACCQYSYLFHQVSLSDLLRLHCLVFHCSLLQLLSLLVAVKNISHPARYSLTCCLSLACSLPFKTTPTHLPTHRYKAHTNRQKQEVVPLGS